MGAEEAFVDHGKLVTQRCSRLQQRLDDIGQTRMAFDEITDGGVPAAAQQAGARKPKPRNKPRTLFSMSPSLRPRVPADGGE